jgi:hypothetical protein
LLSPDAVRVVAEALGGAPPLEVVHVKRSGNNRLYRVRFAAGERALKCYVASAGDTRDRLGAEFGALRFLAERGIAAVPRALGADAAAGCALYEWIDGTRPASDARTAGAMLAFTAELHAAARDPAAAALPWAAEAVRSQADLDEQIAVRLARLDALAADEPALTAFLRERFVPLWERLRSERAAVAPAERFTLSPSDFGAHNMLERPDGAMRFLDFEYFGWDDPVKLVCDVMWHPGMSLDDTTARQFHAAAADIYADDRTFAARHRAWYPLFGLRWALIVLNEFLPAQWERRRLAGASGYWPAAKAAQLAKAADFVRRVDAVTGADD